MSNGIRATTPRFQARTDRLRYRATTVHQSCCASFPATTGAACEVGCWKARACTVWRSFLQAKQTQRCTNDQLGRPGGILAVIPCPDHPQLLSPCNERYIPTYRKETLRTVHSQADPYYSEPVTFFMFGPQTASQPSSNPCPHGIHRLPGLASPFSQHLQPPPRARGQQHVSNRWFPLRLNVVPPPPLPPSRKDIQCPGSAPRATLDRNTLHIISVPSRR